MQSLSPTFSAPAAGFKAPAAAMSNNFFGSWATLPCHGTSTLTSPFGLQNPLLAGTSWLAETHKTNLVIGLQASSAFERQPTSPEANEYVEERKERKMREKKERKEKIKIHRAPRVDPVWELAEVLESLQISEPLPKKTKKGLSVRFAETVVTDVKVVERYLPAGKERKLSPSLHTLLSVSVSVFVAVVVVAGFVVVVEVVLRDIAVARSVACCCFFVLCLRLHSQFPTSTLLQMKEQPQPQFDAFAAPFAFAQGSGPAQPFVPAYVPAYGPM